MADNCTMLLQLFVGTAIVMGIVGVLGFVVLGMRLRRFLRK